MAEKCHTTALNQGHCKKWSQELSLYLLLKNIVKDVAYHSMKTHRRHVSTTDSSDAPNRFLFRQLPSDPISFFFVVSLGTTCHFCVSLFGCTTPYPRIVGVSLTLVLFFLFPPLLTSWQWGFFLKSFKLPSPRPPSP